MHCVFNIGPAACTVEFAAHSFGGHHRVNLRTAENQIRVVLQANQDSRTQFSTERDLEANLIVNSVFVTVVRTTCWMDLHQICSSCKWKHTVAIVVWS